MNVGAKYAVKPQVSQIIAFTGPRQHNIANIFYYFKEAINLGSPPIGALYHIAQNFNFCHDFPELSVVTLITGNIIPFQVLPTTVIKL